MTSTVPTDELLPLAPNAVEAVARAIYVAQNGEDDWVFHENDGEVRREYIKMAEAALRFSPPASAKKEPMAEGSASCPTCNGAGYQGGNPEFGQCDDCGGAGVLFATPPQAPGVEVSDAMVKRLRVAYVKATGSTMWPTDEVFRFMLMEALGK